jgi:hypothetical protein
MDGGSARRKAATYKWEYKQNNRKQKSIAEVGFEPTIPAPEWAKIFHALDRAACFHSCFCLFRYHKQDKLIREI